MEKDIIEDDLTAKNEERTEASSKREHSQGGQQQGSLEDLLLEAAVHRFSPDMFAPDAPLAPALPHSPDSLPSIPTDRVTPKRPWQRSQGHQKWKRKKSGESGKGKKRLPKFILKKYAKNSWGEEKKKKQPGDSKNRSPIAAKSWLPHRDLSPFVDKKMALSFLSDLTPMVKRRKWLQDLMKAAHDDSADSVRKYLSSLSSSPSSSSDDDNGDDDDGNEDQSKDEFDDALFKQFINDMKTFYFNHEKDDDYFDDYDTVDVDFVDASDDDDDIGDDNNDDDDDIIGEEGLYETHHDRGEDREASSEGGEDDGDSTKNSYAADDKFEEFIQDMKKLAYTNSKRFVRMEPDDTGKGGRWFTKAADSRRALARRLARNRQRGRGSVPHRSRNAGPPRVNRPERRPRPQRPQRHLQESRQRPHQRPRFPFQKLPRPFQRPKHPVQRLHHPSRRPHPPTHRPWRVHRRHQRPFSRPLRHGRPVSRPGIQPRRRHQRLRAEWRQVKRQGLRHPSQTRRQWIQQQRRGRRFSKCIWQHDCEKTERRPTESKETAENSEDTVKNNTANAWYPLKQNLTFASQKQATDSDLAATPAPFFTDINENSIDSKTATQDSGANITNSETGTSVLNVETESGTGEQKDNNLDLSGKSPVSTVYLGIVEENMTEVHTISFVRPDGRQHGNAGNDPVAVRLSYKKDILSDSGNSPEKGDVEGMSPSKRVRRQVGDDVHDDDDIDDDDDDDDSNNADGNVNSYSDDDDGYVVSLPERRRQHWRDRRRERPQQLPSNNNNDDDVDSDNVVDGRPVRRRQGRRRGRPRIVVSVTNHHPRQNDDDDDVSMRDAQPESGGSGFRRPEGEAGRRRGHLVNERRNQRRRNRNNRQGRRNGRRRNGGPTASLPSSHRHDDLRTVSAVNRDAVLPARPIIRISSTHPQPGQIQSISNNNNGNNNNGGNSRESGGYIKSPFINHRTAYDFLSTQGRARAGRRQTDRNDNEQQAEQWQFSHTMSEGMCEVFDKHFVPTNIGGRCE